VASSSRKESFTDFFQTATGGCAPYGWQLQVAIAGLPDVPPVPMLRSKHTLHMEEIREYFRLFNKEQLLDELQQQP
jgi:hypothetical protein